MSINRVPILVWGTLTASAANIFAIPAVSLAFFLLWMDRNVGTHFFDVDGGRSAAALAASVLDVRPSLGLRHRAAGDGHGVGRPAGFLPPPAGRLHGRWRWPRSATMVLGLRRVGAPHVRHRPAGRCRCPSSAPPRIIIAMPSAVGVFAWLATIWTGRPVFTTAFLFFASFIVLFTIGGVSGFMTGSVPVDWQLTDTYFVVAHLHYVLIGINVFPVVGAIYFWFPKMTGRCWTSVWAAGISGPCSSASTSASSRCTSPACWACRGGSTPMRAGMGWDWLNLITTLGSFLFAIGVLLLLVNLLCQPRRGAPAGPIPGTPDAGIAPPSPRPPTISRSSRRREPPSALGGPVERVSRPVLLTGVPARSSGGNIATHRARRRARPDSRCPAIRTGAARSGARLRHDFRRLTLSIRLHWRGRAGDRCRILAWFWPQRSLGQVKPKPVPSRTAGASAFRSAASAVTASAGGASVPCCHGERHFSPTCCSVIFTWPRKPLVTGPWAAFPRWLSSPDTVLLVGSSVARLWAGRSRTHGRRLARLGGMAVAMLRRSSSCWFS